MVNKDKQLECLFGFHKWVPWEGDGIPNILSLSGGWCICNMCNLVAQRSIFDINKSSSPTADLWRIISIKPHLTIELTTRPGYQERWFGCWNVYKK